MIENKEIKVNESISKYLEGTSTHEDIILLAEWLYEDEQHKTVLDQMLLYWKATLEDTSQIDYDLVFANLKSKIIKERVGKRRNVKLLSIFRYAAVVAITAVLFFLYNLIVDNHSINSYTYTSGKSVANIELPDGTNVTLNKNTTLTYDDSFNSKQRNVILSGEAFFDVKKDKNRPFTVKLEESSIRVLGTSFNVKNRIGSEQIVTTLVEGSVEFNTSTRKNELAPGEQLIFNKGDGNITVDQVNVNSIIAWKDNLIRYDSLPFYVVMQLLEERYNVTIHLEGDAELKNVSITGAFDADLEIEEIFNLMKANVSFLWKRSDNHHYILNLSAKQ